MANCSLSDLFTLGAEFFGSVGGNSLKFLSNESLPHEPREGQLGSHDSLHTTFKVEPLFRKGMLGASTSLPQLPRT